MVLNRQRRQPKNPRRAFLAGSPVQPAPVVKPVQVEQAEKPKKRTTRKRAPKKESADD